MFYECYKHYRFHIILNNNTKKVFWTKPNSKNITQNSYLRFITHVSKLRLIENPKLRTHLWFITQNHVSNSQVLNFINFLMEPTTCPLQNGYCSLPRVTLSLISPKMKLSCLLPHSPSHPHQIPASTHFRLPSPQNPFPGNPKVWNFFELSPSFGASLRSFSVVGALLCFE